MKKAKPKDIKNAEMTPVNELFKVVVYTKNGKPKNEYYSSEEAYIKIRENIEYRKKAVDLMMEIIGYEPGMVFPGSFVKQYQKLDFYGNKVIYETIVACRETLEYCVRTKAFKNDANKISYLMAVIGENINDIYKKIKNEEKVHRNMNEESEIIISDIDRAGSSKKSKDISSLLGDI